MDYEKAYKEALERARKMMNSKRSVVIGKQALETIFPELRESEDERIRKDLITFICQFAPEHLKNEYVAYLEKQKDKRELDFAEGKVEGVRQTCQEIKDAMSLFEPKDLTPFEFTFRDYIDSAIRYCLSGEGYQQYIKEWATDLLNLERQKEQKPVEPSDEELQRHQDELYDFKVFATKQAKEHHISFVHDFEWNNFCAELLSYFNEKQKPVEIHIDNPNIQKFDPDIKVTTSDSSADGKELLYVSNKSYKIGYRDGVNSVKPAEWSEEDEDMLNSCISSIEEAKENRYAYKETDGDTSYDHEIAWLKSLRPVSKESLQPHWKPSEEQLVTLLRAEGIVRVHDTKELAADLARLYEQLKKLM